MPSDPLETLAQIAQAVPSNQWMLVGGLMVHCHAQRADILHARPTHDADLVVEIHAASYAQVAHAIEKLGFALHHPLQERAPVHRFERDDGAAVDLMAPDRPTAPQRFRGRRVIGVPGADSALRRTVIHELPDGTRIRIPDLPAALALKSEAYFLPGANRERHPQDAVTLLACLDRTEYTASRSIRKSLGRILPVIADQQDAWQMCPPGDWPRAIRAARIITPAWVAPEFIQPRRPGRPLQ